LHCVPIVNIFKREAEPVNNTGLNEEYLVTADSTYPESFSIHQVVSVVGTDRLTGARTVYEPSHSFKNLGHPERRTYATSYRVGYNGRRNLYLSIGGQQLVENEIREESLTLEVYCTNGRLPREELREGSISNPGPEFPDFTAVGNITRPTLNFVPPSVGEYQWNFLGHLGVSYASLADADTLKALLRLYDWSGAEGRSRRIESITAVTQQPTDTIHHGSVLRGVEFTIDIQESDFKDINDLHLFGEVLSTFLSHYVSINSFVSVILRALPAGGLRIYSSIQGRQWLL
jgi:type VI secretion system protein ImpG